jgi:hypothetical protein
VNGPFADARLREPIVGEARGHSSPDQQDPHDNESERPARRIFGQACPRVLDVERDIGEGERRDQRHDLHVAAVPPRDHFRRDDPSEHDEKRDDDCSGGEAANRRGVIDGDPTPRPKRDEPRKRRSGD